MKLFLHDPRLCTNYKHWIHNCSKNLKQFYVNTNKTCALNLIWGEGNPTFNKNVNKTNGKVYIIHTFAMESPSFSSLLVDEREKKI